MSSVLTSCFVYSVANQETSDNNGGGDTVAIGFTRALLLPSVIPYALAFGFFKLVCTAIFFFSVHWHLNMMDVTSRTVQCAIRLTAVYIL